jgi:uncharacterized protein (DUF952 family)
MLFHITDQTAWQSAQSAGVYRPASIETAGFIHLSGEEQLLWVAQNFYQGQLGLVLLGIQVDRLEASLRYDKVPGQGTFPHLYGALNLDAVVKVWPFKPGIDGRFALPVDR